MEQKLKVYNKENGVLITKRRRRHLSNVGVTLDKPQNERTIEFPGNPFLLPAFKLCSIMVNWYDERSTASVLVYFAIE